MKVLINSDALFALYFIDDTNHLRAKKILGAFSIKDELFVANLVLQESVTVISRKIGQKQALDFLKKFKKTNTREIFVDRKLTAKVWRIFKKQTKKSTSFIDCANLVIAQELKIDKIFSFDKFYSKLTICLP
jgi:predicted nucleic acid-binding protein